MKDKYLFMIKGMETHTPDVFDEEFIAAISTPRSSILFKNIIGGAEFKSDIG